MNRNCIAVLTIALCAGTAWATLTGPGDITFTGFNADGSDDFAIVCLAPVEPGAVVEFCDNEWDGSSFATGEADFRWTAPTGGISAGTVVTFNNIGNAVARSVSEGTIEGDEMNLSASGETVFGYLGTNRMPTAFLASISTTIDNYNGIDGTLSNTALAVGLTAILLQENTDGGAYVGTRSNQAAYAAYLPLVADSNNWQVDSSAGSQFLPFDTTSFTLAAVVPTNVVWMLAPVTPPVVTTAPGVAIEFTMQSLSNGTLEIGGGESPEPTSWSAWTAAAPTNAASPYVATNSMSFSNYGTYYYAARWRSGVIEYYGVNDQGQTNATVAEAEYMVVVTNPSPVYLVITEVLANSSNQYSAFDGDWFEVYNADDKPVDLTGMTWDDQSAHPGTALLGSIVLGAGRAHIVFIETLGTESNFITMWWQVPTTNTVYSASGNPGLNATGDEIHIFDPKSNEVATLTFGESEKGYSLAWDADGMFLGVSQEGLYGAYRALDDGNHEPGVDVGSPGFAVPEPVSANVLLAGLALWLRRERRT